MSAIMIRIYIKKGCQDCKSSEDTIAWLSANFPGIETLLLDIGGDAAALSEFAMFQLKGTPSLVVFDVKTEEPIKKWEGKIPSAKEILEYFYCRTEEA